MKTKCEYEKQALVLDTELVITNMQITLEETQVRYQVEIDTRDEEIETLRDIIKKNKKLNIPVVVAASVAVGFGVGFGTYHFASR
jgi:glutaredoxin